MTESNRTNPDHVTFTGLDEKTDLLRVKDLSDQYPVEWGILFSPNNTGKIQRYPSLKVIETFFSADIREGQLAAHLCGGHSNMIMEQEAAPIWLTRFLQENVGRVQINLKDGETNVTASIKPLIANAYGDLIDAVAVLQCRGPFPNDSSVDWLFDCSGGAGVRGAQWPTNAASTAAFVGYAGGLGPDTIIADLEEIWRAHNCDIGFWIDMEGRVRTDEWLDLDKCESVLKQIYDA